MNLTHEITLPQVWVRRIRIRPTKTEPSVAVDFRLWLTPTLSDKLDCYEAVFEGITPKPGVGAVRLVSRIQDCKLFVKLGSRELELTCSEISAPLVTFTDEGPELRFTAVLNGQAPLCAAIAEQCGVDPVSMRIEPCQQSLPLDEQTEQQHPKEEEEEEEEEEEIFNQRQSGDVIMEIIPRVRKASKKEKQQ